MRGVVRFEQPGQDFLSTVLINIKRYLIGFCQKHATIFTVIYCCKPDSARRPVPRPWIRSAEVPGGDGGGVGVGWGGGEVVMRTRTQQQQRKPDCHYETSPLTGRSLVLRC